MATGGTTGAGWPFAFTGCPLAFAGWPLAFACCPGALLDPIPLSFGTLKEVVGDEEGAGDWVGGEEEDGDCGCGADP